MPRSENLLGSQPFSSQLPSHMPSLKTSPSPQSSTKKKHICSICERSFTTSGHLARHSRVHTGERNHRCPFPGCETRCSRQDNLQQHYRIHLSPGSRRNAARTNSPRKRTSTSASSRSPSNPVSATPQHPYTPHVEQCRIISRHCPSPDSTPPLTQATLPSASTLAHSRISPASSPSTSYSPNTHDILPAISSPDLSLPVSSPLNYNHRSGTASYQSPSDPYSSKATGTSQNGSHNAVGTGNFTYSQSYSSYGDHSQQHSRSTSPSAALPSRHSLSQISNPRYPSSHGPPSPTSVSSQTSAHSGPPTPTYHFSYADTYSPYSHPHNAMVPSQAAVNNSQNRSQSYLFQNAYTPNVIAPRYLPPLTLAPIQDERYVRRLESPRYSQSHNPPYLHHSQPLAAYPPYYHSLGLGHKVVGATVI